MAKTISASSENSAIELVIEALASSKPVAIPTETVYGLAADCTSGAAVAKIFSLKNRPQFNPLICHVSSMEMAETIGVFSPAAATLAKAFWPGPLTLVVNKAPQCPVHDLVTAGLDTVGIRWPRGIAEKVIAQFGKPLAAPSANKSGRVSPTSAQHVGDDFLNDDLLILDDGPAIKGIESTIISVSAAAITILRPGSITAAMIEAVIDLPVLFYSGHEENGVLAPGMMASHYAPDASVLLDQTNCTHDDCLLAFGENDTPARSTAAHVLNLSSSGNLEEAASNLYAYLKELDAYKPTRIRVEPIPNIDIGIAINDRLNRAAAPRGDGICIVTP